MDRILATHTGSLIRPPELLAFLAAKERGQDYDEEAYQKCLRASVKDVVDKQAEAGIDVVDDGEMGKASWITYLYERVSGLEVRPIHLEGASMLPPSRDRQAFPGAYAALDALDEAAVRESNAAASNALPDEEAGGRGLGVHRSAHIRPQRARPRHRELQGRAIRARRHRGVPPGGRAGERLLAPERALRAARRSSSSRSRTPCTRSTRGSSTPACSSRSTMPC